MKKTNPECQACEGLGKITYEIEYDPGRPWSDDGPAHYDRTIGCGDCGGSGVVDADAHAEQTDRGGAENCRNVLIELDDMTQ